MSAPEVKVNKLDSNDPEQAQAWYEAFELFFHAYKAFTARPDAILAERGLARLHHRILYFVARKPGQRVSELLLTLGVSKQAIHGPLRQLVELGLVSVAEDEQDRRGRCLSLSAEGAALEARLSETQRELLAGVFADKGEAAELAWRQVMKELAGRGRAQQA